MGGRTLYEWFAGTVARVPDAAALEVEGETLAYRELEERVAVLAGAVAARCAGPPRRVGLLAARSVGAYAGYLAALRLGAAVVPLNPGYPPARNGAIARLAAVDVVVADAEGLRQEPELHRETLVPASTSAALAPVVDAAPEDDAYLLFTSGSTGRPKGVPIVHANVSPFVAYNVDRYEIGPGCRLTQTFDLTFDPSVFDMFVAWGSGATLVVPGRQELLAPVEWVNERRITHWYSVPSVVSLARRLGTLRDGGMPDLRASLFAGEQLTLEQADAWSRAAPSSFVENLYGPTELTVTVTAYRLPAERARWPETPNGTVPIGTVYPHLEHLVLDGELCVRGPQRFRGYLDPADDDGRFVSADGGRVYRAGEPLTPAHWYRTGDRVDELPGHGLVHLGRVDEQIKVRGHRIEPGEIEAVLRAQPGIVDAVVLARRDDGGEVVLEAVFCGAGDPEALRAALRERLPPYMHPQRYVRVAELPLTASGKVDRRRLSEDLLA